MVRVTDDNTDPKHLDSVFRNPEGVKNAWSQDDRKFFVVGPGAVALAFGSTLPLCASAPCREQEPVEPFQFLCTQGPHSAWSIPI